MIASDWVGPSTSLASIVLGAAAGWFTSELRLKRERREVADRQRLQIRLAANELLTAVEQIEARAHGLKFLNEDLVYVQPKRPSAWDRGVEYYLKYDLVDAVYRLCALLGWMEVYRTDATFLLGAQADRARLEHGFVTLRRVLAEPRPARLGGGAPAGSASAFILEDDQRAIGEQMFGAERPAMVIGYAAFCERLFRLPKREDSARAADTGPNADATSRNGDATTQNHWVWNATIFVLDFAKELPADGSGRAADDPRQVRLTRMIDALHALVTATRAADVRTLRALARAIVRALGCPPARSRAGPDDSGARGPAPDRAADRAPARSAVGA